ncbi:hypothetical protein RHMOL_Rhmol13G0161700 [Rhododendron molle]|uniref:Uncharacterized protein n=2 Tax=Rhododendron molle TaxID=49168 RepID=A0ACC0L7K6_RHOML|nr:hypothetical protein RHMOL_Rhmol13G0161700 [Rhododendron molle]KAI8524601.1 hypothetical protein RHMOL_Rhmol13G0161700 [Rhododendron molle]
MASSSTPPPPAEAIDARNWAELPRDVTAMILKTVGVMDLLQSAQKVCMAWRSVSKDPDMWRSIHMSGYFGEDMWDEMGYDVEKMATHAIDRSCGQLVEFSIKGFGSDELLDYIGERASQLRRLQIIYPWSISDDGLSETAKKLPLLEELHIYSGLLSKDALLNVGRCCPHLKSLKFNSRGSRAPYMEYDDEALAIAETMPGLHHLQLLGNNLTDDGLKAILDGCPNLESLDLRHCFNVNLGGSLRERCSEQIKYLRQPYDSTDDCEFDMTFYNGYDDDYSLDDDYPSGFSEIDLMSDVDGDEYFEFSCGSDVYESDYEDLFFGHDDD